jgi:gas vesicle protein
MSETICTHPGRATLYLILGAAAGATVALLTAPRTGLETRRQLKKTKDDLTLRASRVKNAINEAYKRATEAGKEGFMSQMSAPSRVGAPHH